MRFGLRTGDGYKIEVFARRPVVVLSVGHTNAARRAGATTSYVARGTVGAGGMHADFAGFGRVSMRFRPSGRVVLGATGPHCGDRRRTATGRGLFVGSLRFRGEGGYVTIDAHRAKGTLTEERSPYCPILPEDVPGVFGRFPVSEPGRLTYLSAGRRQGIEFARFSASTVGAGRAHYFAETEQGGERLAIYRDAYAEAPRSSFATDDALSFATLGPPAPFVGVGLLERNPDGSRAWAGSLSVSFPGDPDVPLTGPGFKTFFTRSFR
jgi:hypothetical protein